MEFVDTLDYSMIQVVLIKGWKVVEYHFEQYGY